MRSALEVADVFRRHGAAYRDAHAGHLSRGQRRVMGAIETCRSAALGSHVEQCNACGELRIAYNSCRNRHCPKCQGLVRAQWLADRQSELLPVPYFHVVFTVPAPIAEIALHNKAVVYGILFTAAAETLRVIAADPRHLGAEIGLVAVLHTWGQNLHHHPHVHCVVPGGGPSADRTRWIGCRPGFFLPVIGILFTAAAETLRLMIGHNTDWYGFAESFRRELADVPRSRLVQLGAGGGGSAVGH